MRVGPFYVGEPTSKDMEGVVRAVPRYAAYVLFAFAGVLRAIIMA